MGSGASRSHGEIMDTPEGYLYVDISTNGSMINGSKVEGFRLLKRGDVIHLAGEEFRFHGDS
ncbi:MAG: FHA domain-containing protein [Gemmatimonadales bacterium]